MALRSIVNELLKAQPPNEAKSGAVRFGWHGEERAKRTLGTNFRMEITAVDHAG